MRSYEEVIQKMGETMYHCYMEGGDPHYGAVGSEIVGFIYGVSSDQVIHAAYEAYEAHWPATETPYR
jgi:hypothetical protein